MITLQAPVKTLIINRRLEGKDRLIYTCTQVCIHALFMHANKLGS